MARRRIPTYWNARFAAVEAFERAYWKRIANDPRATSYRQAASLAGVTTSVAHRRLTQYKLRLKHGRRS